MKRLLVLAVTSMLLLSGCTLISASGGGWMPNASDEGNGKATYGFDIWCNGESGYLNGSWVYQDKVSGINAHGTLTDTSGGWVQPFFGSPYETGLLCSPQFGSYDSSAGLKLVYEARPCPGGVCEGGWGYILLTDSGVQGPDKGDTLTVDFQTGPYAFYDNSQTIGGGNLTVFAF